LRDARFPPPPRPPPTMIDNLVGKTGHFASPQATSSRISNFPFTHLAALGRLFVQVFRGGEKAALVNHDNVVLNANKIWVNTSKHKAMRHCRMLGGKQQFESEMRAFFRKPVWKQKLLQARLFSVSIKSTLSCGSRLSLPITIDFRSFRFSFGS
jgi:hypothetical protein